ncbi:MAG TPA: thioesterase family protein [Acidimicrobiales bacterium]|jgi:acyl-CoA thioesterase-2|nr:thioesterase family protein [Acidimicrobiales bacterium]
MGNLGVDTAVVKVDDHRYRGVLNKDWEIWGPMGGYIASYGLRAIAAESAFPRPASFSCHYLAVAAFEEIEVVVTPLRSSRVAGSYRAEIWQGERRILECTAWAIADGVEALEHDEAVAPDVAGPEGLMNMGEYFADEPDSGPPFPFWNNFECRPLAFRKDWPPPAPLPAVWQQWIRFLEGDHSDPWVDACRALVLVDVQSWPAASPVHAWKQHNIYAPSLDLYVALHRTTHSDWLLTDGHSPVGEGGLLGWTGRLWDEQRQLIATGGGQLLCRPMRA